jgi:hypothetical protein
MLVGWASRGASKWLGSIGSLKVPGNFKIDTHDGIKSIAVTTTRRNPWASGLAP